MTRFLGIDIGTTFLKGAILDLGAGTISHIQRIPVPEPIGGLPSARYELDPGSITAAVRELLGDLLLEAPDATALVICSQMHSLVLLDDSGNPRSNIITWKDQRALEPAQRGTLFDELSKLVTDEEKHQLGGEMRVGVPITTLYSLVREGKLPPKSCPTTLADFVLAKLCEVEPTTDPTLASAQGLFHVEKFDWHRELIARLGFDQLRWPRIRKTGEVVGVAAIEGHRLTCYTPVGDQQCALLGAELLEGELSLNISTGSQTSLIGPELPRGDFQARPYFNGKWLRTIVSIPAGRSLGLLVNLLMELSAASDSPHPDPWEYIRHTIDRVETTDLEVDLSFFSSLKGERGSISNIREGNLTVGHLFAAAFLSMAANYSDSAGLLSPRREWKQVVFSGGLAQSFSRLRKEVLAKLGNPPHRLCTTEEDTLAGLLMLARMCTSPSTPLSE